MIGKIIKNRKKNTYTLILKLVPLAILLFQMELVIAYTPERETSFRNNNFSPENGPFINDTTSGILTIKVLETAGTHMVKYLGWARGEDFIEGKFNIGNKNEVGISPDGYFRISQFNAKKFLKAKKIAYLILYNDKGKQIGHISYEYNPKKERPFIRQLVLVLHNTKFECYDNLSRKHFPYSKENPFHTSLFGGKWTYFMKGEYPVTMLIPPDYREEKSKPWLGNKFPAVFNKTPVLFIHGLTGKYHAYSKANTEENETSYWWMQVKYLNEDARFAGWQLYYPFDANIDFIAKWIKFDVEYIFKLYKKQLNLITHSMGGMVTLEMLSSPYFKAKERLNKILLSQPPIHGSLGGNKQYRTSLGRVFQLLGFDREAPSIRDLSYGSDFYYNLHKRKFPSLDNDIFISDDYFVLLGTSPKEYKLPEYVHKEASGQSDGIMAISSGSLLDHSIRFATFNGNHDDGRGCWSMLDEIVNKKFLAELAINYFTKSAKSFDIFLSKNSTVDAYIQNNTLRLVQKVKREHVNLKQGVFNVRFSMNKDKKWQNNLKKVSDYIILKDPKKKVLYLTPSLAKANKEENFLSLNGLNEVIKLYPKVEGYLSRNSYTSEDKISYYYNKNPSAIEDCVSDMQQGTYTVFLNSVENNYTFKLGTFKFEHLKTNLVEYNLNKYTSPFFNTSLQMSYSSFIAPRKSVQLEGFVSDSCILIEENTEMVIFQLQSPDAYKKNLNLSLRIKNPANYLISSKLPSVSWFNNKNIACQYYVVKKPTPGLWNVLVKSNVPVKKSINYKISVHVKTNKLSVNNTNTAKKKSTKKKDSKLKSFIKKVGKSGK